MYTLLIVSRIFADGRELVRLGRVGVNLTSTPFAEAAVLLVVTTNEDGTELSTQTITFENYQELWDLFSASLSLHRIRLGIFRGTSTQ